MIITVILSAECFFSDNRIKFRHAWPHIWWKWYCSFWSFISFRCLVFQICFMASSLDTVSKIPSPIVEMCEFLKNVEIKDYLPKRWNHVCSGRSEIWWFRARPPPHPSNHHIFIIWPRRHQRSVRRQDAQVGISKVPWSICPACPDPETGKSRLHFSWSDAFRSTPKAYGPVTEPWFFCQNVTTKWPWSHRYLRRKPFFRWLKRSRRMTLRYRADLDFLWPAVKSRIRPGDMRWARLFSGVSENFCHFSEKCEVCPWGSLPPWCRHGHRKSRKTSSPATDPWATSGNFSASAYSKSPKPDLHFFVLPIRYLCLLHTHKYTCKIWMSTVKARCHTNLTLESKTCKNWGGSTFYEVIFWCLKVFDCQSWDWRFRCFRSNWRILGSQRIFVYRFDDFLVF